MQVVKRKILASVDDGHQLDMTLADLLLRYRIPTIWYIPVEMTDLSNSQIRRLAGIGTCDFCWKARKLFQIGAHTLTHPQDLKKLSDEEAVKEIAGSKQALENILIKKKVDKFCYPRGRFNNRIKEIVKNAGFKQARTTRILNTDFPDDPFEIDPSIHVHPERKEYKDKTWIDWGYLLFDEVIESGGRFEIFMHSWEIEKYNMWGFLEEFLAYMDERMEKIKYIRKI